LSILIDVLIEENLITIEQFNDAKDKQMGAKKPIQDLLVEMGFVEEKDLIRISSKVFKMPVLNLAGEAMDCSLTKAIPYETAKRYGVFPVRKEGNVLVVAMSNPNDVIAIDDLRIKTGMQIKPVLSSKSQTAKCIEKCYQSNERLYDILKNVSAELKKIKIVKEDKGDKEVFSVEIFKGDRSPVVRLVNLILNDAVKSRTSDIHIEPREKKVEVRYRVDGNLKNIMEIPSELQAPLTARIKILGELDIAESKKPQDGRVRVVVDEKKIDLRVSIMPTFYGEKVVMRLLDTSQAAFAMKKLGFDGRTLNAFKEAITKPQGMILATGPTGSGKTTTLYAALNFIKSEAKNIITIEDPIEYLVEGVNQIQVNPVKNVTFANGLRSILRQDPNVIMVGEIRDEETAEIAFRASLTGHLVFSTLHTNDTISSITRLRDIGLEPYLIASSLSLVIAQRLVRVICPHCKEEYSPSKKLLDEFKVYIDKGGIKKFERGKGCEQCGFSGFLGRAAVFEMLEITEEIKKLIAGEADEGVILEEAKKEGFKTLAECGIEKVAEGVTTLEEVAKIIGITGEAEFLKKEKEIRENRKILIVDDEEDVLKIVEKRLKTDSYEVIKARDGKEAVERSMREKPDLIVMDVTMPKMNGFEATKILRSKLETAVIPIILLTARTDKENELKGLDAGADDYITKPFDGDKLLARVKMLFRRRK